MLSMILARSSADNLRYAGILDRNSPANIIEAVWPFGWNSKERNGIDTISA
jgi:hypothetical protein